MLAMTPWEVIEEALNRRRPQRGNAWLAEQLGTTVQAVGNWRTRGVPAAKRRAIGHVLGLTVDQIDGEAPLPWEKAGDWPFPDKTLLVRVDQLEHDQRVEIQAKVREMTEAFERNRDLGKGTPSKSRTGSQ